MQRFPQFELSSPSPASRFAENLKLVAYKSFLLLRAALNSHEVFLRGSWDIQACM